MIEPGDGINVRGSGTLNNPYVIENSAVVERYFNTLDSPTVDLTLEGGGTPGNPFVISAEATIGVSDLVDLGDGQVPVTGDTLVFVVDHWEFQPPPTDGGTVPNGGGSTTVTTGAGLSGTGAGTDPLKAAVSGTWGSGSMAGFPTDKTLGTPTYTDNAGQIRARPMPVVRFAVNPLGSYDPGWGAASTGTVFWYQYGQQVYYRAFFKRTGASITTGSGSGNIANSPIGTLASGLPTPLAGEWPALVTGTGKPLNVYVDGNRKLMVSGMNTNSSIATNDEFSVCGTYWAASGIVL